MRFFGPPVRSFFFVCVCVCLIFIWAMQSELNVIDWLILVVLNRVVVLDLFENAL